MIVNKQGDLFKDLESWDILIHGCNCHCSMKSGIAKTVKDLFPKAFMVDQQTTKGDFDKIGKYTKGVEQGKVIINAYTQKDYLPRGIDHFEYEGFERILKRVFKTYPDKVIAMPKIGSGLAGGDWNRILGIIKKFSKGNKILIYTL